MCFVRTLTRFSIKIYKDISGTVVFKSSRDGLRAKCGNVDVFAPASTRRGGFHLLQATGNNTKALGTIMVGHTHLKIAA